MKTFVCIASGPSLKPEDCLLVKDAGLPVIAVNSSWEMVPWCDHIYAGDHQWWQENFNKIGSAATLWCGTETTARHYAINHFDSTLNGGFNSGQRAILLALYLGADRVILLGYDCSIRNGRHWHSDHESGLKNPDEQSTRRWQDEFLRVRQKHGEARIINCSRYTELKAFQTASLEEQLQLCRKYS